MARSPAGLGGTGRAAARRQCRALACEGHLSSRARGCRRVLIAEAKQGDLVALGAAARPTRKPRAGRHGTAAVPWSGLSGSVDAWSGWVIGARGRGLRRPGSRPRAGGRDGRRCWNAASRCWSSTTTCARRPWIGLPRAGLEGDVERIEDGEAGQVMADLQARPAGLVILRSLRSARRRDRSRAAASGIRPGIGRARCRFARGELAPSRRRGAGRLLAGRLYRSRLRSLSGRGSPPAPRRQPTAPERNGGRR